MHITQKHSPNFSDRRPQDAKVNILLLHHTAMNSFDSAANLLCDKKAGVSAHYIIGKNGEIAQLVSEEKRAWHAGKGYWAGQLDINSHSIGIELDNNGFEPFSNALIRSLIWLAKDIVARHNIPQYNVIGHCDVATSRKQDPNAYFPWDLLQRNGIGLFPIIQPNTTVLFKPGVRSSDFGLVQKKLAQYGYSYDGVNPISQTNIYDNNSIAVITAFKRHFNAESCTLQKDSHCNPSWFVDPNWTQYDDDMLNALHQYKIENAV